MKIISKLAIRNLKLNRKRSIVTVIGIILSVALIVSVTSIIASLHKSLVEYIKYYQGDFHDVFVHVNEEQLKDFEQNVAIEEIRKLEYLGYAYLDDVKNEEKHYAKVVATDYETMDKLGTYIVSGRYPENENEIVVSSLLKAAGGSKLSVGDTIELDIGTLITPEIEAEATEMSSMELQVGEEPYKNSKEYRIENPTKRTFKIVGVIVRNGIFERYDDPGFLFMTYKEKPQDDMMLFIRMTREGLKRHDKIIAGILGIEEYRRGNAYDNVPYEVVTNMMLVSYENMELGDWGMNMLAVIGTVVLCIIIFTSIFCIRNSFDVSLTEKIRQFGCLSGIGATKKQLKKSVILEAMYLLLVGLSLGLVTGIGFSYGLIRIIDVVIRDITRFKILFTISIPAILVAIVLSVFTVYFSAIKCAGRAARIIPIEIIRGNNEIKLNRKKLKTPRIIKRLWGTGGVIAQKSIKRNKRKYKTTVTAIVLCSVLFIITASCADMFLSIAKMDFADFDTNVSVRLYEVRQNTPEIKELFDLSDNGRVMAYDRVSAYTRNPKYTQEYIELVEHIPGIMIDTEEQYLPIIGLSDDAFLEYARDIGIKDDDILDNTILIDSEPFAWTDIDTGEEKRVFERVVDYKAGDSIEIEYEEWTEEPVASINRTKTVKKDIVFDAVTDKTPFGLSNIRWTMIITSASNLYSYGNYKGYIETPGNPYGSTLINYMADDADRVQQAIEEYCTNHDIQVSITNMDRELKDINALVALISSIVYGIIVVIALIGITSIINTVSTGMELRAKEFASLISIGMTKKELNKMLLLEGFFIGGKSLFIGVPLGCILSYVVYYFVITHGDKIPFSLPVVGIVCNVVIVFIVLYVIMGLAIRKVNRRNIIETIKNENI